MLRCPHCQKLKATPALNPGAQTLVKCTGCSGSYAIHRPEGGTLFVAKAIEDVRLCGCPHCKQLNTVSKKHDIAGAWNCIRCTKPFYIFATEIFVSDEIEDVTDWSKVKTTFQMSESQPLEWQLQAAIAREDYETAVQLRDQIKELTI